MIRLLAAVLLACAAPVAAVAQGVGDCDGYQASVRALAEPWEQNTRQFANGAVRLAVVDTVEPAAGGFHLVILSPPYDEIGSRQCAVVSTPDGIGFAGLDLIDAQAGYDAATGLSFAIPARRWSAEVDDFVDAVLSVTLNQATGAITARLD
jgi:hypothetical protein